MLLELNQKHIFMQWLNNRFHVYGWHQESRKVFRRAQLTFTDCQLVFGLICTFCVLFNIQNDHFQIHYKSFICYLMYLYVCSSFPPLVNRMKWPQTFLKRVNVDTKTRKTHRVFIMSGKLSLRQNFPSKIEFRLAILIIDGRIFNQLKPWSQTN